ncbi:MAG: ski2-type helicase, partial [Nanohaloarchaea archaeon SW_4_43_9]
MKVENLDLPERIKQDYINSGITEMNLPQKKAVNAGLMEGEDMIVASPTASGKTFIAELAMVNQVKNEGGKAVYIVPLKALASEKYQDFKERYKDLDVMMSVGDRDESGDYLETADIVIVTSEKLDSMLRHNPSWIHEINLVVTDEIHLLTSPNRGPTLEVTLTRLRDLLDFQMLGLSATISNSSELADWLKAELVESDYRPVELKEGIMEGNEIEFFPEDYSNESSNKTNNAESSGFKTGKEIVKDEEKKEDEETEEVFIEDKHGRPTSNLVEDTLEIDKQAIVFCSSRKGAEKSSDRCAEVTEPVLSREERQELKEYSERILNILGSPTSQCKRLAENVAEGAAFHHAGLVNRQRSLVEEAFRKGLIKTVSATPTLAAGINLPAYRVIMRDLKRYTGGGM